MDAPPRKNIHMDVLKTQESYEQDYFFLKVNGDIWEGKDVQSGLWVVAEFYYHGPNCFLFEDKSYCVDEDVCYLANRIFIGFTTCNRYLFKNMLLYACASFNLALRLYHRHDYKEKLFHALPDEFTIEQLDNTENVIADCLDLYYYNTEIVHVGPMIEFFKIFEKWDAVEMKVIYFTTRVLLWTLPYIDCLPSLIVAMSFYYTSLLFGRKPHCVKYMELTYYQIGACERTSKELTTFILQYQNNKFKPFDFKSESTLMESITKQLSKISF
jgi:hypothetical protein